MSRSTITPPSDDLRVRRDHRILADDGASLAVTDWAVPGSGDTAVFLHGLCLSLLSWKTQIGHLQRRCGSTRIIGYDHRGHGDSSGAGVRTYRIEQLADDLDQVLTALKVTGPVTLIGHSLGAMVALNFLSRRKHRCAATVRGLVLCTTAAGRLPERGVGRLLTAPMVGGLAGAVEHVPDCVTTAVTIPMRMALDRMRNHGGPVQRSLTGVAASALANTPLSTAVGFLPSLRDFDQHHSLTKITAHTTILSGGMDVLTPPAHAYEMAAAIPNAVHVHVPHAGHMLPQQAPGVVSDAIVRTVTAARLSSTAHTADAVGTASHAG
ncbi:alpha/beta fold hydrolase [Mycolicibacterium aubagnense]|uniref:Alpha/beta hydrolase n=1 Tax=Mycolicibacterium aubagnense TaxID=319707 RepID=A0ABN5Z4D1_9MYCO|nr:alpha/beta hydrolase [Mycolicibacterium aubagnense]TLH64229.1 alpha/beta hydrolase [Mycolicibacterium aubagnense]BBX87866.1 alpha/beta hydrolase [Mycolicibacterium aubagnense]